MKKKSISIALLLVISLFIVFQFALANSFPGTVTGSTTGTQNTGTVTVTNATPGETLKLYLQNTSSPVATKEDSGTEHIFHNLDYGKYYVTSTRKNAEGNDVESSSSPVVEVKPEMVTIVEHENDIVNNRITFINAQPGAEVFLHNDRVGYVERKATADSGGNGTFVDVPPGKNYRAYQVIREVKSELSTTWANVLPNQVRLTVVTAGAGTSNNGGAIRVLDTEQGNTLYIYRIGEENPFNSKVVDTPDGYTFTGLSAGEYVVRQEKNGVLSTQSNSAKIIDEQNPTIELVGPATERFSMPYEYTPRESDVIARDNIKIKDINWQVSPDIAINTPGEYKITYTVRDDADNQASVTKTVIIAPYTLTITETIDTLKPGEPEPGRATGEIKVEPVMPNATLYLYQDPDGKLIKTITETDEGIFTIPDVPVGKGYYVIQVVKGIASDPSTRVEIEDTTPPILKLLGQTPLQLIMGERYVEPGAYAIDNIDDQTELSAKIQIDSSNVNVDRPGEYTVYYNVADNAGNKATQIERKVVVSPQAVVALGSTADLGEVGVSNAFPGAILKLYDVNDSTEPIQPIQTSSPLPVGVTTYVFKNIKPGSYYVTQTFGTAPNDLTSANSNIVDVVDTDRPYITLNGADEIKVIYDEDLKPDYESNEFKDPGATAVDYLDGDLTGRISKTTIPDIGNTSPFPIPGPGLYKITYNVEAIRGAKADSKHRTLIVAPPRIKEKLEAKAGESKITIPTDVFIDDTTIVTLYNTNGLFIKSVATEGDSTAEFTAIPAGIGYYVTQTVNGIESAPSDPVNVTLFENAKEVVGFTSFQFEGIDAIGLIDQEEKTITVTVPKDTNVTNLKASFTTIKTDQTVSPTTATNFTNPVTYTVTSQDGEISTMYTVTVIQAKNSSEAWENTVNKSVTLKKNEEQFITLSPTEQFIASEKGVSFMAEDTMIHVSPANVEEARFPALTVTELSNSAVIETNDPAWKESITNITKIGWGGETKSFLQPIEVEMSNPDNKLFAKLVREDGKLYAIIQPSYKSGQNIVGLTTEPGMYALVEGIKPPRLVVGTQNYSLLPGTVDSTIYYTTNSKQITFDRSTQNSETAEYLLSGTPKDLTSWTIYETNKPITIPGNELYFFAEHNQMISSFGYLEPAPAKVWRNKDVQTVPRDKVWNVSFSAKVDKKALYAQQIYVTDDTTGNIVETTLSLSKDGKTVLVTPKKQYATNKQYTLWIDKQMKGNTINKEFLKQPTKISFIAISE